MSAVEERGPVVESMEEALTSFLERYPAYKETSAVDELREVVRSYCEERGVLFVDCVEAIRKLPPERAARMHLGPERIGRNHLSEEGNAWVAGVLHDVLKEGVRQR